MDSLVIRPVVKADLPDLMTLDHSSKSEHVWQLELRREPRMALVTASFREVRLPRAIALNYPNDPHALAEAWKRSSMMCAAIAGADTAGYLALAEPRTGAGWITDVVVAPKWRRKGIAGALLEEAHRWCIERGDRTIFFEMQSKNHPAMMLARSHGYEFCGYNDRYYSNQDIALLFARSL